jgi:hypothetical protein
MTPSCTLVVHSVPEVHTSATVRALSVMLGRMTFSRPGISVYFSAADRSGDEMAAMLRVTPTDGADVWRSTVLVHGANASPVSRISAHTTTNTKTMSLATRVQPYRIYPRQKPLRGCQSTTRA